MSDLTKSFSLLDSTSWNWKTIAATALIGKYFFETYVDYRQYEVRRSLQSSQSIASDVNVDVVLKNDNTSTMFRFASVKRTVSLIKELFMINFDILPKFWSIAAPIARSSANIPVIGRFFGQLVISQSLVLFFMTSGVSALGNLPLSFLETFFLKHDSNLNLGALLSWFVGNVLGYAFKMIVRSPAIYVFCRLVDSYGTAYVPYMCAFSFFVDAVIVPWSYTIVVPLFNDLSSSVEGDLKTKLEKVAKTYQLSLRALSLAETPKGSAPCLFLMGLPWGSQRAVIYSSLIDNYTTQEIVALFVSEVGRWKLHHFWQKLVARQAGYLVPLVLFSGILQNKAFFHSFGFSDVYPAYIGYFLFSYVYTAVECVTKVFQVAISRRIVYEKDEFTKSQGYGEELAAALRKQNARSLNNVCFDWLYSAYNMPNPTVADRLAHLGSASRK